MVVQGSVFCFFGVSSSLCQHPFLEGSMLDCIFFKCILSDFSVNIRVVEKKNTKIM